jgi:hypothetical protein
LPLGRLTGAVAAEALAGALPAPATAISMLAQTATAAVMLAARRLISRAIAMPFP